MGKKAGSASKEEEKANAAADATARRAKRKQTKGLIKYYVAVGTGIAVTVLAVYLAIIGDGKTNGHSRTATVDTALVNDNSFMRGVTSDAGGNFTVAASSFFNRWSYADVKYGLDGVNLFGQALVGMPGALQYCKSDDDLEGGVLPPAYDVREAWPDCIGEVYDAGNCSSSYAIAAASSLSARFCIADSAKYKNLRLSAQQMLSCDKKSKGCQGGGIDSIWAYIQRRGLYPEECVAFAGGKSAPCKTTCEESKKLHLLDHCLLSAGEKAIKREIYNRGPVVVPLYLKDDYLVYSGGVYSPTPGSRSMADPDNKPLMHAATILGWGKADSGERYWIVGHSWGTGWGENGYARVAFDSVLREGYVLVGYPATEEALQQKQKKEEEEKLRREEAKKERAAREERIKEKQRQRAEEQKAAQEESDLADDTDTDFEEEISMDDNEM